MIVPMKKITLVILEKEREAALSALRQTGVLHVEKREASSQTISELQALVSRLDQAYAILADFKAAPESGVSDPLDRSGTLALVDRIFALRDERRLAQETVAQVSRELDRLIVWGDVNPADFAFLATKGLHLLPFEMSYEDYHNLPDTITSIPVSQEKKTVRCLLLGSDASVPQDIPAGARELALPSSSSDQLRSILQSAQSRIPEYTASLARESVHRESIVALKAVVLKELEFETVRSGMPLVVLGEESVHTDNTSIAWLTGFMPASQEAILVGEAKKHGWAVILDEPSDEDNVPTQLKNNRFVSLINPLMDFLGTVPGYRELDISLWFLLFFGIFFAMIFGDGGYGALLVALSLVSISLTSIAKKAVAPGLYMLLYLGMMTVAWGTVTCTWFGIPADTLPVWLQSVALPAFSNLNPAAPVNIKVFCFSLGLIQISLAHVIGIFRNIRSLKLIGEFGALILGIGMFYVVLNLVVDSTLYPLTSDLGKIMLAMVLGGFALNFLFINYSDSIIGGVVESLKNIITMLLGVVNMFGDIMSYIRLWAVGLAGAAISSTINTMAGPMLGGFLIFGGIILLFFGHGLNLIMNVLSVIVHGVRLNTLEFSNHLGLTWSGFKYEPFSETVKK